MVGHERAPPPAQAKLAHCPLLAVAGMRKDWSGIYVSVIFLISATRLGEAFLSTGSRFTSAWQRPQHDLPASSDTKVATASTAALPPTASRITIDYLRVVPADASTEHQLPSFPGLGSTEEAEVQEGAAQPPPAKKDTTRRGTALDGTPLVFRPPTSEDLHKLKMGSWVARKGLAVALVVLDGTGEETRAAGEAVVGAPLAGAVVEAMEGVGGSSVATRVCLLRHRREDGVPQAVEHALLDETINQFLNDGARISQVCFVSQDDVDYVVDHVARSSAAFDCLVGAVRYPWPFLVLFAQPSPSVGNKKHVQTHRVLPDDIGTALTCAADKTVCITDPPPFHHTAPYFFLPAASRGR